MKKTVRKKLWIFRTELNMINTVLKRRSATPNLDKIIPTLTQTVDLEHGYRMEIRCCTGAEERVSKAAWAEAILFYQDQEVMRSKASSIYQKTWSLETEDMKFEVPVCILENCVTDRMRNLLKELADLAEQVSDEVYDDDDESEDGTSGILALCDLLVDQIDTYLKRNPKSGE